MADVCVRCAFDVRPVFSTFVIVLLCGHTQTNPASGIHEHTMSYNTTFATGLATGRQNYILLRIIIISYKKVK